jgi:hypothetical protein
LIFHFQDTDSLFRHKVVSIITNNSGMFVQCTRNELTPAGDLQADRSAVNASWSRVAKFSNFEQVMRLLYVQLIMRVFCPVTCVYGEIPKHRCIDDGC